MLKRMILFFLCCVIMMVPAFAEGSIEIPEELPPRAVISEEQLRGDVDIVDEMTDSLRAGENKRSNAAGLSVPITTDQVSVASDGSLTVVTEGVSMSLTPPFGAMAFAQDVLAQFDVYAMFEDPGEVVQHLQDMGAHMCIVDLVSGTEIYAVTGQDMVSAIVEDIDAVSEDVLSILVDRLQESSLDANISLVDCGGNSFMVFDYRKTGTELLIYTSVKNNTNIDFVLVPGGDTVTDMEIETLESVLSGAQLAAA